MSANHVLNPSNIEQKPKFNTFCEAIVEGLIHGVHDREISLNPWKWSSCPGNPLQAISKYGNVT